MWHTPPHANTPVGLPSVSGIRPTCFQLRENILAPCAVACSLNKSYRDSANVSGCFGNGNILNRYVCIIHFSRRLIDQLSSHSLHPASADEVLLPSSHPSTLHQMIDWSTHWLTGWPGHMRTGAEWRGGSVWRRKGMRRPRRETTLKNGISVEAFVWTHRVPLSFKR